MGLDEWRIALEIGKFLQGVDLLFMESFGLMFCDQITWVSSSAGRAVGS